MIGVLIAGGSCALNVWMYATSGDPINFAAAVFCAICALACAVIAR